MALAAFLGDRTAEAREADDLSLPEVADQFAEAVREQWSREAQARRLNDPYPLPVAWRQADPSLFATWDSLVTAARTGAGWPAQEGPWISGPGGLAGEGRELADLLIRIPTGRLVVLGGPGAGKSVLMVRLVLDLLARRAPGGPVPVLVSVASWDPAGQEFREWLAMQLSATSPGLNAAVATDPVKRTRIQALIDEGFLIPVLDGLDEMPDSVRGRAIAKINDSLQAGGRLVITCRTAAYRKAVRPNRGTGIVITAAAGVELLPVSPSVVVDYLRADAGGPTGAHRWDAVFRDVDVNTALMEVFSSPLMVALTRVIYNPRPGEAAGGLPSLKELDLLTTKEAIEAHLLDAFIPAAYRSGPVSRRWRQWSIGQSEAWLEVLASHLERTLDSTDLAWWQLARAIPRRKIRLAGGLTIGAACGAAAFTAAGIAGGIAAGLKNGPLSGIIAGLLFGIFTGLSVALVEGLAALLMPWKERPPSHGLRLHPERAWFLPFALVAGLLGGILNDPRGGGLADRAGFGLLFGLLGILPFTLQATLSDLSTAIGPRASLRRDRRAALSSGIAIAVAIVLLFTIVASQDRTNPLIGVATVSVVLPGVPLGVWASCSWSAWPRWLSVHNWLALRRKLPWRLMSFLEEAHAIGILRQVGTFYQFSHVDLQRRLARRSVT